MFLLEQKFLLLTNNFIVKRNRGKLKIYQRRNGIGVPVGHFSLTCLIISSSDNHFDSCASLCRLSSANNQRIGHIFHLAVCCSLRDRLSLSDRDRLSLRDRNRDRLSLRDRDRLSLCDRDRLSLSNRDRKNDTLY